ncbi:MAG: 30S ribosome-binding factor RbfA [Nitrospinae bacterium]|nr:30S ribosome-binding factor RbfA [Nitrospinota bacterium]
MFDRREKLSSLIKEVISECVQFRLKDPRVGMICITRVEMNRDKSIAKIFYSSFDDKKESSLEGLMNARGYMRTILGKEMKLKRIPDLRFYYDDSSEFVQRIRDIAGDSNKGKTE